MSSTIRSAVTLAVLAALLPGCRGEDSNADDAAPPVRDGGAAVGGPVGTSDINAVNTSTPLRTGRDAGAGARAYVHEKLDLRVRLHQTEVVRGRPILARLELHNLGAQPLVLISPDELLAKRLHLRVTQGARRLDLRSARPPDRSPREVVLGTAQMVSADVDLLPLLRNTLAYEEGRVRVIAVYDGAADLLPESESAWNRDGGKSVTSEPQILTIAEPRWREELGSSRDVVGSAANLLTRWRPGAPNTDEVKAAVLDRGDEGIRALFYLVSGMTSTRRDSLLRANRAFEMLLLIAPQAAEVARGLADVESPPVAMVRDLVLAEVGRRLGGREAPPAKIVRSIVPGGARPVWISVDLVETRRLPAEQYLLDGSGRLTVERRGPGGGRRARELSEPALRELREALLATQPWLWQVARRRRVSGEGRVTVRMSVDGVTAFEVALPEGEALDANPLARRLLDAFGSHADRVGAR